MSIIIQGYQGQDIHTLGLGVFDGMHIGHQAIANHCDALLSFDPHPDMVLGKNKDIKRLSTQAEYHYYHAAPLFLNFTPEIAQLSPQAFLETIVLSKFSPKRVIVGYDFSFGYKKAGDLRVLRDWGEKHHIEIVAIEAHELEGGGVIKSFLIRKAIQGGEIEEAIEMLGHPYLILGKVVEGEGRGKALGYPTANLQVSDNKCLPEQGVFACEVEFNNQTQQAICYLGTKPTFGGQTQSVEIHIPGLNQDLYGQKVGLYLTKKIRDEKRFENEGQLVKQIKRDLGKVL